MSIFVKPKLKALKEALAVKDWAGVEKNANGVLDFESGNYNARVFLALAQFNLSRPLEAEETYRKAIELSPSQPLARQGLASLYEKQQKWGEYAKELMGLMGLFEESKDATKFAEALEKLLDVRRKFGTKEEIIATLSLLLPTSPVHSLLSTLPPYNASLPTSTTYPTIQQAISSPLPIFLEVISLTYSLETSTLENEIKKRRQRLGGPALTAEETRRQVQAEQMPTSLLPGLWRQVLEDPDAANDENLRRETERHLLSHLTTTLKALPSPFDALTIDLSGGATSSKAKTLTPKQVEEQEAAKGYYRKEVEDLARGMVLLNIAEKVAWEAVVEWGDKFGGNIEEEGGEGGWRKERWDELSRFGALFPESGLGTLATATHQRLLASQAKAKAALVVSKGDAAEGDDEIVIPEALEDDEMSQVVEDSLRSSPDSLVAHLLAASSFRSVKDWESLVQVAEAGLSVLASIRTDIGRELPSSKKTLETYLALALVYHASPAHHLRALRLVESLLAASDAVASSSPDPELLIAKAYILQTSEKYPSALKVWDTILSLPFSPSSPSSLTPSLRTHAQSERAWALHLSGSSESARTELESVVRSLEERKEKREKEREERERWRSKKGVERKEGEEEGEREEEKDERAKGWWRLGECLWKMGESDADLTQQAYDAYIASLRASPSYAPAFTSLGLYYRSLSPPDWIRSSKCFQKAFELDPGQEVAAKHLAEEFAELGEWGLVEVIARRVVAGNKGKSGMGGKAAQRLAWAWKAIGGSELNSKKYPQAIVAFQSALRGSPSDLSTWLKLGTAYRQSGKHIAALKVFVKALALDPSSWFAKYAIADVQREIGLVEPAIKALKEILQERPDELGVKVVLAETSLAKGLEEQRGGFMIRAEESLLEALSEASDVIEGGTATRVAWKVAAEALVGLGKIPAPEKEDETRALVEQLLGELETQGVDGKIAGMTAVTVKVVKAAQKEETNVAALATATSVLAFKMRVLLETQNEAAIGSAWFDLGVSISNFRTRLSSFSSSSTVATAEEALQQSIKCLKYALHKEPLNSTFWNALGVVSFDLSPRLAQHSFIRSIEYNSRSAVPWTNLGLFYLVHGDEDLANQSFLKAQVLDSDWTAAWIGQATLADMAGHAVEASVLLEHAFTLGGGNSPEADYAYAARAFEKYRSSVPSSSSAVAQPEQTPRPSATESLSAPLFALTRYLSQHPTSHHALHLSALILEQVGDLTSASEAFEKAASVIEELYEVDESPRVEGQFVIAQTNLGRVRLALKNYEGASEAFEAALSLLNVEDDGTAAGEGGLTKEQSLLLFTECKLGSALSQLWLGDAETAKRTLEEAREEVDGSLGGTVGDHLSVALAKVYWAEEDEDRTLATLLDAPNQFVKTTSPLFLKRMVAAYAIATHDTAILEATDKFLLDANVKYDPEIARLATLQHLSKKHPVAALCNTSHTLHAFPWATTARSRIAHLLVSLPPLASSLCPSPSSSSSAETSLEKLTSNLDIIGRLLRGRIPPQAGYEDAGLRSRRVRAVGTVAFASSSSAAAVSGGENGAVGEGEQEEKEDEDEKKMRWFEKGVYLAPWEGTAREQLGRVREAVEGEE